MKTLSLSAAFVLAGNLPNCPGAWAPDLPLIGVRELFQLPAKYHILV